MLESNPGSVQSERGGARNSETPFCFVDKIGLGVIDALRENSLRDECRRAGRMTHEYKQEIIPGLDHYGVREGDKVAWFPTPHYVAPSGRRRTRKKPWSHPGQKSLWEGVAQW